MSKKNGKKGIKYIVGGTTAAVALGTLGVGAYAYSGNEAECSQDKYNAENVSYGSNVAIDEEDIAEKLKEDISIEEKDVYKDETVYVFSDAKGNTNKILVSEHLKNDENKSELVDKTDLKDIVNLKGNHEFSQSGDTITWQADGEDIYYQGVSEKELPVNVSVSYYLDGKEISPEELAGKSGRVKIRFDYKNNAVVEKSVQGKKEKINVPFVAVSGMILGDNFSNITVTNGKTIEQGASNIVVGYGMPGMSENLKLKDNEGTEGFTIPEYFEVEADVTDFSLDMTATLVMNGSQIKLGSNLDMSKLDSLIGTLGDAGEQLVAGADALNEGMNSLYTNMGVFNQGVGSLNTGIGSLSQGAGNLAAGITTLNAGAQGLNSGIAALDKGLNTPMTDEEKAAVMAQTQGAVNAQFVEGTDVYNGIYAQAIASFKKTMLDDSTVAAIYQGLYDNLHDNLYDAQVAQYAQQYGKTTQEIIESYGADIEEGIQIQLNDLAGGIAQGIVQQGSADVGKNVVLACQMAAGDAAGKAAITGAESAKQQVAAQIEAVQDNGYSLVTAASAVAAGTETLADSVPALTQGISDLLSGAGTLVNGSGKLLAGAQQLSEGATALNDGVAEFNTEAIQTIINAYNGDVKEVTSRWQAIMEASTEYDTYTSLNDGDMGATKFIIKTEGISAE